MVVQMVCFVIDYNKFINISYDHSQIDSRVACFCNRIVAQEVSRGVRIFCARFVYITLKNSVDVSQKYISSIRNIAQIVLQMESHLKIVLPVLPMIAVIRQNRIAKKYF